jgi:phage terminase large subunit-like protein
VIQERSRAIPEYRAWLLTEDLIATPGAMTDLPTIEQDIRGWCKRFDVQSVVIERFGASYLAANLIEDGIKARLETKNAKTFTAPTKEILARMAAKRFRHTGCTFLRWQASNVCAERRRDGTLLPTKDGPMSPLKIDAFDAILLGWIDLLEDPTATREPQLLIFGSRT